MQQLLTRRRLTAELMDDPNAEPADLAEALRYIRIVNRRLGGIAAAMRHFKRWARAWPKALTHPLTPSLEGRGKGIRILDIGTGSADIPLAIAQWARQANHRVQITGVDLHPVTVELARQFVGPRDDIQIIQADALKLMDQFQPGEFDYAHAGMFLHHLTDVQVMTVLRIMDRLTARGLIWSDLVRGWVGRLGVRLLTLWPGVPPMVRHDAIVSIDAGFTRREAMELGRRAGLSNIGYRQHLLYRFTLVSSKRPNVELSQRPIRSLR